MGREDIKIKSVSFDKSIPLQAKLFDIADSQKNFSEYIRTLMIADMLTGGALSDLSIVLSKKENVNKKYNTKDFTIDL